MAVLETWPWEETSVDVIIVETAIAPSLAKELDHGARKHTHTADFSKYAKEVKVRTRLYLERKGFHVLTETFQYDTVAVRKECMK